MLVVVDRVVIYIAIAFFICRKIPFSNLLRKCKEKLKKRETQSSELLNSPIPNEVEDILANARLMEQQIYDEELMDKIEKEFFQNDSDMSVENPFDNVKDLDDVEVAR